MSNRSTIFLRAHHLLCIWGWKGHGYDEKFSQKMDEIFALITQSNPQIVVVSQADDICSSCSHLGAKGCFKGKTLKEAEIKAHDKRVIQFLGLKDGSIITADTLKKLISKREPYNNLATLCINCEWLDKLYCYNGLRKAEGWHHNN